MVDHVMRAELPAPCLGSGREAVAITVSLVSVRRLDRDDDAACAPMISSDLPSPPLRATPKRSNRLPGRDRGERQGGSSGEIERLRLGADDALVDQMKFVLVPGRMIEPAYQTSSPALNKSRPANRATCR